MKQKSNQPTSIQQFEAHYKNRLGVIGGYVPEDLAQIGKWLSQQVELAYKEKEKQGSDFSLLPSVNAFLNMLNDKANSALKQQVISMITEGLKIHKKYEPKVKYYIKDIMDLMITLNFMIITTPIFAPKVSHSAFPMSGLFVYMMATKSGWDVFKNTTFNKSLRIVLEAWCDYLCSKYSLDRVTTDVNGGWLSPDSVIANNLNEFVTQADKDKDPIHWGFTSFNDFFHRQIILSYRPLAGENDPSIIVSANDGTVYRVARNVKRETNFEIKSQPYSLVNMLDNSYVDTFEHGDVLQTFLSGHDYHRWRAPISGKVLESSRVVPGFMFSELPMVGKDGTAWDPSAGTLSQGYEANVNTRALIFIEHEDPKIGIVCVMPIGITEISSIKIDDIINKNVSITAGVWKGN